MTTLFEEEIECPCCGGRFQTTFIGSTNTFGPVTTDLFNMAAGYQPIHYQVHTCSQCGYSSMNPEEDEVTEEIKGYVTGEITPLLKEKDLHSWEKFDLMAMIEEFKGADQFNLGILNHQAAWCCYEAGKKRAEKKFRKKTIEHFEKALETGDVAEDDLCAVTYVIGELYRRIGLDENAAEWFDKMIHIKKDLPGKEYYSTLAYQQKTNPREYIRR